MNTYPQNIKALLRDLGARIPTDELDALVKHGRAMRLPALKVVEAFFTENPADIHDLKPLEGAIVDSSMAIRSLERPYMAITAASYDQLMKGAHDYYVTRNGRVVTFGTADGGFALMPLKEDAAAVILASQTSTAA